MMRGRGDGSVRRAGGSGDAHVVRPEAASDGFDGVVNGGLHHRAVKEAGRAGMGRHAGDCLYGYRIPIRYGVGSYD
jgi:hypothetical protein